MTAARTYRSARAGETITTAEQFVALPAGFVGREPDGSIVTRLLDGQGAVWRRTGDGRNLFPERVALPLTVLFRPDAPQPATTDDAVERAVRMLDDLHVVAGEATDDGGVVTVRVRDLATLRAALAAAEVGTEVDREHRHACHDGNRDPECAECVGTVDRETIGVLPSAEGLTAALRWLAEQEGVREDWYAEEVPQIMAVLAARGDAATPTEIEWGVRRNDGTVSPRTSEQYARGMRRSLPHDTTAVVQRTVSAWREVR